VPEDLAETAEREFVEESLGVLAAPLADHWVRVVLRLNTERKQERYHATWVVPVAWDADAPQRFLETRLDLEHVDRAVQEWRYARPKHVLPDGRDVGAVDDDEDDGFEEDERSTDGGAVRAALGFAAWSPWRVDEPEVVTACGPDAAKVREWARHRRRVERTLAGCKDHACVTVRRDADGWLQDVAVHKDHLEKDQIRWWTADELQQVLDARGHHGADRFRPYFLPVLQTVLTELTRAPPQFGP